MYQTAWTKKVAPSSLPSDRLRPKSAPTPSRSTKNSNHNESAPPQSKALRTLNAIRNALQANLTSPAIDPTGGCFCQARTHPLSPYTPICTSCALPLCALASPAHLCPSCQAPLLTPHQRAELLVRIDTEIADTTLKEQIARERAEEARRAAAGAFPTLQTSSTSSSAYPSPSPSPSPRPPPPQQQQQTHKVLTIGSKNKKTKTTLTTTTIKPKTYTSASSSQPNSRPGSPQPTREPRPDAHLLADRRGTGKEKQKGRADGGGSGRPWENYVDEDAPVYVPPVQSVIEGEDDDVEGKKRNRRKKGKAKEGGEGRGNNANVPGSSGYVQEAISGQS